MIRFDDETLNLELLAEEASEVIQIKSKIKRYGIDHHWDKADRDNRGRLAQECGHLMAIIKILATNGTISWSEINAGINHKLEKLAKIYDSQRMEKK